MKPKGYVRISLVVSSHQMKPEAVTQLVGLEPTSTRRQGTPTRNGLLRRPEFDLHEWWLDQELVLPSGVLIEEEAEAFITQFLEQFSSRSVENSIRSLSTGHSVLVVVVHHMSYMPYVGLTKGHVEALARLGAGINFDFYIDDLAAHE